MRFKVVALLSNAKKSAFQSSQNSLSHIAVILDMRLD